MQVMIHFELRSCLLVKKSNRAGLKDILTGCKKGNELETAFNHQNPLLKQKALAKHSEPCSQLPLTISH